MRLALNLLVLAALGAGALFVASGVWALWQATPAPPKPEGGSVATTNTGFTLDTSFLAASTAAATRPAAGTTPGPAAQPTPASAAGMRLVIPKAGVSATTITLGVAPDGVMENPPGPDIVAWYRFSSLPGTGGNAVFVGHLDYAGKGPAVFWRLRELKLEDEVQVIVGNRTYVYRVVSTRSYVASSAPVAEIIGKTETDTVTLITCGGNFDRRTRQYDQRLVVKAVRVS